MKKIISLLLAAVISVGGINTVFADNYTDGAAVSVQAETPVISLYGGWHESFYVSSPCVQCLWFWGAGERHSLARVATPAEA